MIGTVLGVLACVALFVLFGLFVRPKTTGGCAEGRRCDACGEREHCELPASPAHRDSRTTS